MVETTRLVRFATVGGIGIGLNTLSLFLLTTLLHIPYMFSGAIATTIVLVYRYLHNNRWSFGDRKRAGWHHVPSLMKFTLVLALYHVVYFGSLYLLTERVGLFYLTSSLLVVVTLLIPNYLACKVWVWNEETR